MRYFMFALVMIAATYAVAQEPAIKHTRETPAQYAKRTKWWREARFGMFIHWGVYAVPADSTTKDGKKSAGEWYFYNKQAQMADYQKFAPQFNPVKFDAHKWVHTAKRAGMKYIVITSKHHDGFTMFGTKMNHDWNIVDATPFHRDPMKELAAECRKQGVKLCFYHSIMDWHNPDYLPRRPWEKETRPEAGANPDRYFNEYMKGQIRELLTNYGPIGVMWFDGEWEKTWTHERGVDLYWFVRSLQPNILVNNRVDTGREGMQGMNAAGEFVGDFGTPEQEIPAQGYADGRLWESCMTMNDTWGYARNDENWKSTETLIHNLVDIASKGGNYLLNVGPTELGEFPEAIQTRLEEVGKWMDVHGEAIHGTTASPFKKLAFDGRCTAKGNTLYLHVFHWPAEGLRLDGLKTKVESARSMEDGEEVTVTPMLSSPGTLVITHPHNMNPYATTIEVKLAGKPVVE